MKIMLPSSLRVKNCVTPALATLIFPVHRAAMLSPKPTPWLLNGFAAVSGQSSCVTPPVVLLAAIVFVNGLYLALNDASVKKSGFTAVIGPPLLLGFGIAGVPCPPTQYCPAKPAMLGESPTCKVPPASVMGPLPSAVLLALTSLPAPTVTP